MCGEGGGLGVDGLNDEVRAGFCGPSCPKSPHTHPPQNNYCTQCAGYHDSAACPEGRRYRATNVLGPSWRAEHVRKGQLILDMLDELVDLDSLPDERDCQRIQALVAVAQIHFTAAALPTIAVAPPPTGPGYYRAPS